MQRRAAQEYKVGNGGRWGVGQRDERGHTGRLRTLNGFEQKEGVMEVIKQRARLQFLSHFLPLLITLWKGLGTREQLRNPLMEQSRLGNKLQSC